MLDLNDYSNEQTLSRVLRIRKKCDSITNWMIDNKCTIRSCADNLNIPKSTVHRYIHTYIRVYYDDEYCQLLRLLDYNIKHRRGRRKR